MMHVAYPIVSDYAFRGCVRYLSLPQAPGSSYTPAAFELLRMQTSNATIIHMATLQLAPEWREQGYQSQVYEKPDVPDTDIPKGDSLDLAYLLASIRCTRRLVLDALEDAGDLWCTGALALVDDQPVLRAVGEPGFTAKLQGFEVQTHDRLFLVPAVNMVSDHYQFCQEHNVAVLSLDAFRRRLPEALAAGRWATKVVITVDGPELPRLVATLLPQQRPWWLGWKSAALLLLGVLGLGFVAYLLVFHDHSLPVPAASGLLRGIAVSPDGAELYVANEKTSEVLVIDRATRATRVRVSIGQPGHPETPQRIVPTPDGRELYVTNAQAGTVIVIDRSRYQVKATIPTGPLPRWVTITPDGTKAYVSNEGPGPQASISVIDTASYRVVNRITDVNCPEGSAVTPDGRRLYVASQCGAGDDPVYVIDTSTDAVIAHIPGLAVGMTLAVTPDGRKVYVARGNYPWPDPTTGRVGSPLSVIEVATRSITHHFPLETSVTAMAMTRNGHYLLVGNGRKLSIIDTTTDQVVKELKPKASPFSIAIADDGWVYVTLPEQNRVWYFGLSGLL